MKIANVTFDTEVVKSMQDIDELKEQKPFEHLPEEMQDDLVQKVWDAVKRPAIGDGSEETEPE
jgi:hypothetical protein